LKAETVTHLARPADVFFRGRWNLNRYLQAVDETGHVGQVGKQGDGTAPLAAGDPTATHAQPEEGEYTVTRETRGYKQAKN